ncbi:MAG: serine hydrolase [Sulfolobales archaeon]
MPHLEEADPEELGFSGDRLRRAIEYICGYAHRRLIPGIEVLVVRRGKVAIHEACGYAQIEPIERPLRRGMLFDLASLTKPIAGSLVAGQLVAEGIIHLKQRVSEILPEFSKTPAGYNEIKDRVRIWMLLAHSSGLPPWLPLYRSTSDREEILMEAVRSFPIYEPGTKAIYSDIGYMVFTKLVEELTSEKFDHLFYSLVAKRLGLKLTLYNPLEADIDQNNIVSTEATEHGGVLTGIVHDENARAMGGVSAHAGLFSTAEEVGLLGYEILRAYRGESDLLLPPAYARSMLRKWICGDRCYGLGWWIYDRRSIEAGGDLLVKGFGHTGFTGTSLWIDPILDIVIVILTNRVHPKRDNHYINLLRPIAHNMIISSVKANRSSNIAEKP